MRRALQILLFALVASFGIGAFASSARLQAQPFDNSPEGGMGYPGTDVNEAHDQGIVNWWSWDYGPTAKNPSHRDWPPPFGFAFINFVVFAGIMYKLCAKPLRSYLVERHDQIRNALNDASRLRGEAQARLDELEHKVAGADREIETLLAQIRKEAEMDKERIVQSAREQAERLKSDAQRQIAGEIERARRELRQDVIEAAVSAADQLLRQQIGAADQQKMAERYVSDLEHGTAPKVQS